MFNFKKQYSSHINITSKKVNELIISHKKSITIGNDGKYKYWLTPSQISVHSLILGDTYKRFEKNVLSQYMKDESNVYLFSDNVDLTIEMLYQIPESKNYNIKILDMFSIRRERDFDALNIFNKCFSISTFLGFVETDLLSDSIDGQIKDKFIKSFSSFIFECSNLKSYYSSINDVLRIFETKYYNERHQTFSSSKKCLDELNLIWDSFYKISFYDYLSQILLPYNNILKKDGETTLQNFKSIGLNNILIVSMPKEQNIFAKRILMNSFASETTHHLTVATNNERPLNSVDSNKQSSNNNVVFFVNTPLWASGVYNVLWRASGYSIFYSYADIESLINNNKNKEHYYSFKANVGNLFLYDIPTSDLYKKEDYPKIHQKLKKNEFLYLNNNLSGSGFRKISI